MLASFRRTIVDTWVGRLIALLFIIAFAGWGIGDVLVNILQGRSDTVATAAGQPITQAQFDQAFQLGMRRAAQERNIDPSSFDAGTRRQIAQAAVEQLVSQTEVVQAARRQGLRVPDAVLREAIFALPGFQGPSGGFDRAVFDQRLQQMGMSEATLLSLMRADLNAQGLINAFQAGVVAPAPLVDNAFAFGTATRTADYVSIPFPDPASIPAPDEATLRRWYDNHPDAFRSPEYRRIKAVVLTPDTIARTLTVPDADVQRAYDMLRARYVLPERRSVDILVGADQARMAALAASWRQGGDFATVQKQAGNDAAPVSLTAAPLDEFPSPELGRAVFAATQGAVTGPVQTSGGWAVFKVSAITPPQTTSFAQAKPDLVQQIARARAADEFAGRAAKLRDAIAGGGLDAIPDDLGAVPLLGALDAAGMTQQGQPAPLAGSDALRQALVAHAFATGIDVPPALQQVGSDGDYALVVEAVIPAATRSFADAHDAVLAAWRADQARRQANAQAASLYARAQGSGDQGGGTRGATHPGLAQALADMPQAAGLTLQHSPPIGRDTPPAGVPGPLARIAFDIPVGQSTMVEDGRAFVVATITGAQTYPPSSNRLVYGQTRDALTHSLGEDIGASYVAWLRGHDRIDINSKLIDAMVAQP